MLQESGETLHQHLTNAADTYANYECLTHIIAIERWGQRRLRTLLGQPVMHDECDDYAPSVALFWPDLIDEFRDTRQDTIELVQELEQAGVDPNERVGHNELGMLSVKGWVRYLDMHANLESKKIQAKNPKTA